MTRQSKLLALAVLLAVVLAAPRPAQAYIGPGAGFALAGSFLAVFAAVLSALVMLFTWPARLLVRTIFGQRALANSKFKRIVVLGLDGLDYGLTRQMLADGKLPNLAKLAEQGCFKPLASTLPPISPVAWSSFQTGVNPGKHNIFDFLVPDERTYAPKMSSVDIRPPGRMLRIGKYQFPLSKARLRLLRKSQPFWSVLSRHGISSCILRVPITFPAEKLRGVQLSAMCVPDLRGTQGTFAHFTTKAPAKDANGSTDVHVLTRHGSLLRGALVGPENPLHAQPVKMTIPFTLRVVGDERALLQIGGAQVELRLGEHSPWVKVKFRAGPGVAVQGVCKFVLLRISEDVELYVTPINIDPEKPVMPIGYPAVYSVYLAKRQGPFATLGLAEDTWALNERVLDDRQFLAQCEDIDREREIMFFDGLEKLARGLCVCVFDGTDRLQHMFWRYLDAEHPARRHGVQNQLGNVVENLYRRMDELVGRTAARCAEAGTLLLVISDHGFNSFRRGIDLNRWLEEHGYLVVHEGRRGEDYLAGVDWTRTRAFALGLTGIFINEKRKFEGGIIGPEEAKALREEIAEKLAPLVDPASGARVIKRVYQAVNVYRGPYKDHAPDLIIGYERGYRVSWDAAIGRTSNEIFHDNTKAWSGDHCVDPSVVPGVLFANRPIEIDNPRLIDLAPTILAQFGLRVPDYMDGKAFAIGP